MCVRQANKCVAAENGPKGKCELSRGEITTGRFMSACSVKLYIYKYNLCVVPGSVHLKMRLFARFVCGEQVNAW